MNQSTKRTAALAIFLSTLSAVVFGIMVYQVMAQGDRLVAQIEMLQEQNAQEASYYRLQRIAEESSADREKIQSFFLQKEGDSIDFLNSVEALAPAAGVALETDTLKSVTEERGTTWIEATFSFSGNRHNVQNFVHILETLPYLVRLTKLDMEAQSPALWRAAVVMQVQVVSYDK